MERKIVIALLRVLLRILSWAPWIVTWATWIGAAFFLGVGIILHIIWQVGITTIIFCTLMGMWAGFSVKYVYNLWIHKDPAQISLSLYDAIPTVFTTLGILGTFVGIFMGLRQFNVNQITESIPQLLEGLKTAFLTSIMGLIGSLIFSKITHWVWEKVEKSQPPKPTDELAALLAIATTLQELKNQNQEHFRLLNRSLVGETDGSLSTQLVKLRNQVTELEKSHSLQHQTLLRIQQSLGGDEETSLLTQVQKIRAEQNEHFKENQNVFHSILASIQQSQQLVIQKFDEFAEVLARNNTETLVEVMKRATEEFNAQMSELVSRLVQENFEELNNSVQRMNQWQQENKEMIQRLIEQFHYVSNDLTQTAVAIKEITENTAKLTDDNSHLVRLIEELQRVMIEDTKFQEIVDKLNSTIQTLKANTETFEQTTHQLKDWVRNQMNFTDSVAKLLTKLEEVEKIKDINEIFWKNLQKQLNEAIGMIEKANNKLASDLGHINEEFYKRLNTVFENLDQLIQSVIKHYDKKLK